METVAFIHGPYDGLLVERTPDLKRFYFIPIDDDLLHQYEMEEGGIYVYKGEFSMVTDG